MKTVILKIESQRQSANGAHAVFPVTLVIDGRESTDEIPVEEVLVKQQDLVHDPGTFRGRELGGDDAEGAAGGGLGPNAEFAQWLHPLVFGSRLAAGWLTLVNLAADGFRLVLDIEPPELLKLRWEQIGSGPVFPAIDPQCAVVRGRYDPAVRVPLRDGPLRILVVVGSKQGDTSVLAEEEVAALKAKLDGRVDQVELKVLERPTRDARPPENKKFSDQYREFKPHVFHFIGHGKIDQSGEPCLVFYDEQQDRNTDWRLKDIISEFGLHKPTFVLLNACHSIDGAGRLERSAAVWSISDTFTKRIGARGVLGMHGAVKGDSAGYLAAELYDQVIKGIDLDVALTWARIEVDRHRGVDSSRVWDWVLPYLRVTVSPDQVLGMAPIVRRLKTETELVEQFRETCTFVNRVEERRHFLNIVQSDPERMTNLVLVNGRKGVGKSGLICYCLKWAAIRGRLVKYVELDPEARDDDLGLLRLICEGESDSLIDKPLPHEAMSRFYQTLNAVLAGADSGKPSEVDTFPKEAEWYDGRGNTRKLPDKGRAADPVGDLFRAFHKALEGVPAAARRELAAKLELDPVDKAAAERVLADDRPFLIVIDQVSRRSWDPVRSKGGEDPSLLRPIAEGLQANVLVVLGVKREDYDDLGLGTFRRAAIAVELKPFSPEEFERLAQEYFDKLVAQPQYSVLDLDPAEWTDQITSTVQRFRNKPKTWNPDLFMLLVKTTYTDKGI